MPVRHLGNKVAEALDWLLFILIPKHPVMEAGQT